MPDEYESFLRDRRPEPRDDFVQALEDRLLAEPKRRRAGRRPLLVLCAALATAALLAVLGVAGTLPLGLGSDEPVRATSDCATVMVEKTERRPVIAVGPDGELEVTYRNERVTRPVRRCR